MVKTVKEPHLVTPKELAEHAMEHYKHHKMWHRKRRWGKWRLVLDDMQQLQYLEDGQPVYWIGLEQLNGRCWRDSWLMHLSEKSFITNKDLGDFVRAVLAQIIAGRIKKCAAGEPDGGLVDDF